MMFGGNAHASGVGDGVGVGVGVPLGSVSGSPRGRDLDRHGREVVAGQVDDAQHDDVRASVFEDVGYLGIAVGKFPVPEVPQPVRRIAAGRRPVKRHRERRLTGEIAGGERRDRVRREGLNATHGKYSICWVADVSSSSVWPPKMNPRIGVISWNSPLTWTVAVLFASSGQPLLLQLMSMSASSTSTIDPFDSSCTRHTIRLVAVSHGWSYGRSPGLRGLEGALARGVQQRDVRVVDPAEVEDRREEDHEQRQDECELDQALAPRPGPPPAASEEFEQVHLGHRYGFGVSATRMLGAVTYTLP